MIIEKILPLVIIAAMFITGMSAGGSSDVAVSQVTTETTYASEIPADEYHTLLMEQLGADLIARGKEAGFSLSVSITGFTAADGSTVIVPDIEIRSAIGTAMYDSNTVDWQLMREIQYAAIDANLFALSTDAISELKNYYYTPEENYADEDIEGVNIHINETPFGYEAIFMMRYTNFDSSNLTRNWSCSYTWDELTYDSNSY